LSDKQDGEDPANDNPEVLFYFGLTAVENLGIDFGIGYKFADTSEITTGGVKVTNTINNPLYIGLTANYNAGGFGIKFRTVMGFAGSKKVEGGGVTVEHDDPFTLGLDILPSFAVNDKVSVLFGAGLYVVGSEKIPDPEDPTKEIDSDPVTAWYINPYITVKSSWWAPNFYAGIRIDNAGGDKYNGDKTYIQWSVPIGMAVSF